MKLLITGGTGFIGQHLVRNALAHGFKVMVFYRSFKPENWDLLPDLELVKCDLEHDLIPRLDDHNVDCVIHLAAEMTPKKDVSLDQNSLATEKLLTEMKRANVRRLIGISSISVLAFESFSSSTVISETAKTETRFNRMGLYSASKRKQEELFIAFGKSEHNVCTIFRPGIVYDEFSLNSAHAGIIKNNLQLLVSHHGQVPVVNVSAVIQAILKAVTIDLKNSQIFHLLDDQLPTQSEYQKALIARKILKNRGLTINWRVISTISQFIFIIFETVKLERLLPDVLLPHAFAARMKPFNWSNLKVKERLNWQAKSFSG